MPKKLTPTGQAASPVEPNVAKASIPRKPATKQAAPPPKVDTDTLYVRNLHHIESRVTLTTGRVIHLMPRGQREDVDIISVAEREDPRYIANLNLIFELITAPEAREIISKQQTNSRQSEHPIWAQLRNERGEEYTQRVVAIEETFERQGYVVGQIEETGAGRFTDKNYEVTRGAGPNIVGAPGSPGHPATERMLSVPGNIDPQEYHEFLLWKQFKEQFKEGTDGSE